MTVSVTSDPASVSRAAPAKQRTPAEKARSQFKRWVWAFVALGLLVRLVYVIVTWNWVPLGDTAGYVQRALYIWEHGGNLMPVFDTEHKWVADTWWPPVYPYFLSLLISLHQLLRLVGLIGPLAQAAIPQPLHSTADEPLFQFLRVLLTVFGVLNVPLVAAIGRRMMGRRVGLTAAALMAVYPPLIYVGASLYPESLFVVLMLSAILCAIRYAESASAWWLAAAGVLTGLAILTHSNAFVMLIPLGLGVWKAVRISGARRLRALWAPGLVVVMTAVALSPWTIRNEVKLHKFIPVSSSFGPTLAGTYDAQSEKFKLRPYVWVLPEWAYPEVHKRSLHMKSYQAADAAYEQAAFTYIQHHPFSVAQVGFWNSLRLFELTGPQGVGGSEDTAQWEGVPHGLTWVGDFCVWIFMALALAATRTKFVRRGRYRWVWLMPLVWYLSVVFITVETPRFRAGIDPFLVLAAAAALVSLRDWVKRRGQASRSDGVRLHDRVTKPGENSSYGVSTGINRS